MLGGGVKHDRVYVVEHAHSNLTLHSQNLKRHDAFDLPDVVMRELLHRCLLREKQKHATVSAQNAQRGKLLPAQKDPLRPL
jgi:hypothetical protein